MFEVPLPTMCILLLTIVATAGFELVYVIGEPILETAAGSKSGELVYFNGNENAMVWVDIFAWLKCTQNRFIKLNPAQ